MNRLQTVEDALRAEYFEKLLPDMRRTLVAVDAEVRHLLLPISVALSRYEHVSIVSRLKDCDSAIDSLRRRQEARLFDPENFEGYSLASLPDLVGVRILAFPRHRSADAHSALLPLLADWTADPVPGSTAGDDPVALKYRGRCASAQTTITAEIQIVSRLIGSFWEVEHAALYKPSPNLQGVLASPSMKERTNAVLTALRDFENEFERLVGEANEIETPPSATSDKAG
jgi:ppGpp synthetase/RelA/SpoT-type nucleotidyltranferase